MPQLSDKGDCQHSKRQQNDQQKERDHKFCRRKAFSGDIVDHSRGQNVKLRFTIDLLYGFFLFKNIRQTDRGASAAFALQIDRQIMETVIPDFLTDGLHRQNALIRAFYFKGVHIDRIVSRDNQEGHPWILCLHNRVFC